MARRRRRQRFEYNADVNVVSLIDVMLLLLVIFMITAPMMQGGVDLSLPKASAKPMEAQDALQISVNRDGAIVVDGRRLASVREFRVALKALAGNRSRNGVYLSVDKEARYEVVAQILAIMREAGIDNVGLAMEPEVIR